MTKGLLVWLLLAMLTEPVLAPVAVGENVTLKVAVPPGATLVGAVPLSAYGPVKVKAPSVRASVVLLLLMVNETGAEALPCCVLAKPVNVPPLAMPVPPWLTAICGFGVAAWPLPVRFTV